VSASPEQGPEAVAEAFELRLARSDEFAAVGDVTVRGYHHDGFLEPEDSYARVLRDAAARAAEAELWIAADPASGALLGTVTFCPEGSAYRELGADGEGEFRMLAVDPSARGRGVAKALVRRCLDRSRQLGLSAVVLCSLPTMTAAHSLYGALGFVRDTSLDWSPVAGVELWGFRRDLD